MKLLLFNCSIDFKRQLLQSFPDLRLLLLTNAASGLHKLIKLRLCDAAINSQRALWDIRAIVSIQI